MSFISKLSGKVFQIAIDKVMGSGLMQEETTANGERAVTTGMPETARLAAAEGCVLLKNDGTLPFALTEEIAVFGRCQLDWFYVGYGSGGDVKAPYYVNLIDGLNNAGAAYNKEVFQAYKSWCESSDHTADHGWWAHWPTCYPEMPLTKDFVQSAAKKNRTALVAIGRAAGEDRECTLTKGSYFLTDEETAMMDMVTEAFPNTVVVIDTGNIIDLSWTEKYGEKISALLIAWLGGMESGNAVSDVLYGKVNPCGKLTDTIAVSYEDYPSSQNFGGRKQNEYKEGIYVGYRHFDKYAKDRILFPFGFGLSYTTFATEPVSFTQTEDQIKSVVKVTNTGSLAGKEVVPLWCQLPQNSGTLDKPLKVLAGFSKTPLLEPGCFCEMALDTNYDLFSSYDEKQHAFILDKGIYHFQAGTADVGQITIDETTILKQCEAAMCSAVPLKERILERLPEEIKPEKNSGGTLDDVVSGNLSLDDFIASLSLEELEALTRGHGMMNSRYGASGNAGAFGGIIPSLIEKGVEPIITTDGPSGLRLNRYASLLPCGTALASTWNTELVKELYSVLADEMKRFGSDVLLAPGMNIHRNPLCGRNFEYYSEDPLLSGRIAAAAVHGIQSKGASACPKHLACNNQEIKRNTNNSIVPERALREIYLKNFEICIKESHPLTIMSSYNKVNGVWSHYHYDMITTILRKDWGFDGVVLTDWWMQRSASPEFPHLKNNAYRVRAQVDVLMPGDMKHLAKEYKADRTLLASYGKPEGITKGELQRTARNVLKLVIKLKK